MKVALPLALLLLVAPLRAQPADVDTLLADAAGDPLEEARVVRDHRASMVATIGDGSASVRVLRASRWLDAADELLEPLLTLAGGDDPERAPAAALAAWHIVRALDARDLAAEERPVPAAELFAPLAADESARPDIRRMAQLAQGRLTGMSAMAETSTPAE